MHPPFSFRSCRKENGPCTVQKKRPLGRAPVQWPSARNGGRRIGACSDFSWHSGTLGPSVRSILPSRGGWCGDRRGGHRMELLLFSLPLAAPRGNWRSGPIKASAPTEIPSALRILWGPTCVSALARVTKATSPVGADALVRPPAQAATTAQAARSDCAAVGGSAVLRMRRAPCGQAERAEGGTSGTLVTEILGAPQRETGKEELVKSLLAPRPKAHPRRGNQPPNLCVTPPRPSAVCRKHAGTLSRRPPYSNFARMCKVAAKAPFSLTPGAARSLFGADKKRMGAHLHGRQHG